MQLNRMNFETILHERERRIEEINGTNMLAASVIYDTTARKQSRKRTMPFRFFARARLQDNALTITKTRQEGA